MKLYERFVLRRVSPGGLLYIGRCGAVKLVYDGRWIKPEYYGKEADFYYLKLPSYSFRFNPWTYADAWMQLVIHWHGWDGFGYDYLPVEKFK